MRESVSEGERGVHRQADQTVFAIGTTFFAMCATFIVIDAAEKSFLNGSNTSPPLATPVCVCVCIHDEVFVLIKVVVVVM